MVLNGKEYNMLIGDPYKFAVLFDRVKKWNPSLTDNNGFLHYVLMENYFLMKLKMQ